MSINDSSIENILKTSWKKLKLSLKFKFWEKNSRNYPNSTEISPKFPIFQTKLAKNYQFLRNFSKTSWIFIEIYQIFLILKRIFPNRSIFKQFSTKFIEFSGNFLIFNVLKDVESQKTPIKFSGLPKGHKFHRISPSNPLTFILKAIKDDPTKKKNLLFNRVIRNNMRSSSPKSQISLQSL